jgi:hypothetical protein
MRTLQLFENSVYSEEAGLEEAGYRNYDDNRTGFSKKSQAYRADGGANDENHEIDRQREQQEKSGTWYIRLNGKLIKDKQGNPYSFRGKAAANKAALTMQAKLFNKGKEFILTTNPNDKPQGVAEKIDSRFRKTEWVPIADALKILKHYGATIEEWGGHFHFAYYDREGVRKRIEDLTWNADDTRNVRLSILNQAVRELKAQQQGVAEGSNPEKVEVRFSAKEYAAMSPAQKAAKQEEWQQLKQQAKMRLQNFTLIDTDKEQGVAEGSRNAYLKHNNLVDIEKPLAGLKSEFEKFLQTHDPKEKQKYQQGIKQRIKSEPMSGPKGVLPEQGVAEGAQQVDSLVTDALKIMQGPKLNDAVQALKTVLGDREYNSRRSFYNFYIKQIIDMYGQQGVNEGVGDSPVAGAITRRILMQRTDLLSKYGPEKVTAAIDEVADFVGDVEEIGSSDVSGWIKHVEQMLGNMSEGLNEDLQADDGEYYSNSDKFFGQFEADHFDNEETSPDGMEIRGYIDGVNVMAWRFKSAKKVGGWGIYDDSSLQEGVSEGAEFGANYAEQLAQKVFNVKPKLDSEDDVLNIGHKVATQDLMSQVRANYLFARDQDFPSDFVSAYYYLQKQKPGVAEAEISQSRIGKMNTPNQEFYGKNPHFAKGAEVKNVGKTVDATGKPVSALATKVTPQFNKPAPVKKLRATPFEEDAGDLQQRLSTLESAMVKARNITKAIKYDGTVSDILVSIRQLAENAGIDARDLTYAENEVFDAKKQLESAIYGLDEIFEDAIQNLQYQIQDAEEN